MIITDSDKFIQKYRRFYFTNSFSDDEKEKYGIPKCLQTTDCESEEWICEQYLERQVFDEWALAWKFGRLEGVREAPSFIQEDSYCDTYGNKVKISEFKSFCQSLNTIDFNSKELESIYRGLSDKAPANIGPVYILTTMFFITGGRIPIYDRFAHRAVRALLVDGIPDSRAVKESIKSMPDKMEVSIVMSVYTDYINTLNAVFPNDVRKEVSDQPYIDRELDQALWVYGHAYTKHTPND